MEDTDKGSVARSQQFPFIALEKAVARAKELDAVYGQNAGRSLNIVKTWGYTEKASGGSQTIAALAAFGLLDDEGIGEGRKLRLSQLATTILKDKRSGHSETALKQAALKPKVLAELWSEWGANRPPEAECLSILHLDKKFREDAAGRLLKIYDATIRYAGLVDSDKKTDNGEIGDEVKSEVLGSGVKHSPPPPAPGQHTGKVHLMSNERVVFSHELRPNQSFRIVVAGDVDEAMVKALKAYADFQSQLVKASAPNDKPDTNSAG